MQCVRPLVRNVARNVRRYGEGGANFKAPHMNELPVPTGSWQSLNEARQRRYNLTLLGGVLFFGFTTTTFLNSGIRFNYYVPEHYE